MGSCNHELSTGESSPPTRTVCTAGLPLSKRRVATAVCRLLAVGLFRRTTSCLAWLLALLVVLPSAAAEERAGERWVESALKMEFVRIPAGTFRMGSRESAEQVARDFPGEVAADFANEHPQR